MPSGRGSPEKNKLVANSNNTAKPHTLEAYNRNPKI